MRTDREPPYRRIAPFDGDNGLGGIGKDHDIVVPPGVWVKPFPSYDHRDVAQRERFVKASAEERERLHPWIVNPTSYIIEGSPTKTPLICSLNHDIVGEESRADIQNSPALFLSTGLEINGSGFVVPYGQLREILNEVRIESIPLIVETLIPRAAPTEEYLTEVRFPTLRFGQFRFSNSNYSKSIMYSTPSEPWNSYELSFRPNSWQLKERVQVPILGFKDLNSASGLIVAVPHNDVQLIKGMEFRAKKTH